MDDTLITQAAHHFGTVPSALTPLSGGHVTAVYEFARGPEHYVLRIIPLGDETTPQDVRAIQAWVANLASHGAPVPAPLAAQDGRHVVVIEHEGRLYAAVASQKAHGILAETLSQAQWTDAFFHNIGRAAGKLHKPAAGYSPPQALRRPEFLSIGDLFGPDQDAAAAIKARKLKVLRTIHALPKHFGMIHGDFHFGNFFVDPADGYAVTVFDFDDCGYGWTIMDTATQLFDVLVLYDGPDREGFARHFMTHYLSGYRTQRDTDPFWFAQLPHFLKLLEISYYALLAPIITPGEDDFWVAKFMPGRRERIEADVPYVDLDFDRLIEDLI
jgi:Ser/Thr protein kinase RdoA (MazF antagonist)